MIGQDDEGDDVCLSDHGGISSAVLQQNMGDGPYPSAVAIRCSNSASTLSASVMESRTLNVLTDDR